MTIEEVVKILAVLAPIVAIPVAGVKYLIKWVRDVADRERTTSLAMIAKAEQERDELQDQLVQLHAKRLEDSREYAQAVSDLSHRFRQAVAAVAKWQRR